MDGTGIAPASQDYVHVVVEGFSERMMAVVRQIALIAHYPNFDEEKCRNKTIITICTGSEENAGRAECEIIEKGYLGNLLQYCKEKSALKLDLTFEFSPDNIQEYLKDRELKKTKNELLTSIREEDVKGEAYDQEIDVYKGMLVNMCYYLGEPVEKLPAYDNSNIKRYSLALDLYGYQAKSPSPIEKWQEIAKPNDEGRYNDYEVKNKLSSLFCSDCFAGRINSISAVKGKTIRKDDKENLRIVKSALQEAKIIDALVKSEHARWNVEKLILGYKPLNEKERYDLEVLFGTEKSDYRKQLKKKYSHIDLCCYKELRRVNPRDLKYDYFLMLAIPIIEERWNDHKDNNA